MNLIIFLYQHILKFRVAIVLAYYMSTVVDTFEKNNPIYREVLLLAAEICVDFSIPTIPGINLFYFDAVFFLGEIFLNSEVHLKVFLLEFSLTIFIVKGFFSHGH